MRQGRSLQEFVQGDLHFFLSGGAQHPLGPEDSLKSIDFTGTGGGGLSPQSPHPDYAFECVDLRYFKLRILLDQIN